MEQNQNENFSNYMQRTFRSWKGSLNFSDGCANKKSAPVLRFLLSKARDHDRELDKGMARAARAGFRRIINLCVRLGAHDFNSVLWGAAEGGHESLIRFAIEKGATELNEALSRAAGAGHISTIFLLKDHGATNFDEATWRNGHRRIAKIIDTWIEDRRDLRTMIIARFNSLLDFPEDLESDEDDEEPHIHLPFTSRGHLTATNPENACSVCLEPYEPGDVKGMLPCDHEFHQACIIRWFNEVGQPKCPYCRSTN
jgi:hypothetical protein